MWKRVLALSGALVLVLGLTVQATPVFAAGLSGRTEFVLATGSYADLSFDGTTVTCEARIRPNNSSDVISMTVKLWKGDVCLKTWTASGSGILYIRKTATVTSGQTYTLTVDATINGVAQPQKSITRTCP